MNKYSTLNTRDLSLSNKNPYEDFELNDREPTPVGDEFARATGSDFLDYKPFESSIGRLSRGA